MKQEFGETYRNVFYQPGENPVFCYRTGLTVYEETFRDGMLTASGWNAAGYPLNVLTNCPTRLNPADYTEPQSFRLDADGETADSFLTFGGYTERVEGDVTHAMVKLLCPHKRIEITIHTRLDGSPCFSRCIEVKNTGDRAAAINRLAVMSGGVETIGNYLALAGGRKPEEFYSLGCMESSKWGKEGDFGWRPLRRDIESIDGRFLRERHRHPMFLLKNDLMGTVMIAQLGWSGGYTFTFDYNTAPEEEKTRLAFSVALAAHSPLLLLQPEESYVSPEVHIGLVQGDADDAVNAMHDHLRKTVFRPTEGITSQLLVGAGMGPEHDMSVETTKRFMDQMADMGCDVFIVDAGWYTPPHEEMNGWWHQVGNWHPDAERYPNGLKEISDYCHEKGMKFGMWMESERMAFPALVAAHPDWFPVTREGKTVETFIDLTNPETAAWVESEAARVIEEYGVELFRVDYNIGTEALLGYKDKNGRKECNALRHVRAVYRLYGNLKKRFPNVIFENCAGGGGRTDVGQMASFNHTWVSDMQNAPRSFYITSGMTMALPPERVDRLVAGMGCHGYASLDFQMRNAMFSHLTMNVLSPAAAEWNGEQMEFIRHSIELYKREARRILPGCRVYHHTPTTEEMQKTGFGILENAAPDGSAAMLGVFSFPCAGADTVTVYPKGILPEGKYSVYFDNRRTETEVSGYELVNSGIRVRIPSAMSSELIVLKRIG